MQSLLALESGKVARIAAVAVLRPPLRRIPSLASWRQPRLPLRYRLDDEVVEESRGNPEIPKRQPDSPCLGPPPSWPRATCARPRRARRPDAEGRSRNSAAGNTASTATCPGWPAGYEHKPATVTSTAGTRWPTPSTATSTRTRLRRSISVSSWTMWSASWTNWNRC